MLSNLDFWAFATKWWVSFRFFFCLNLIPLFKKIPTDELITLCSIRSLKSGICDICLEEIYPLIKSAIIVNKGNLARIFVESFIMLSSNIFKEAFVIIRAFNVSTLYKWLKSHLHLLNLWSKSNRQKSSSFLYQAVVLDFTAWFHNFNYGSFNCVAAIVFDPSLHFACLLLFLSLRVEYLHFVSVHVASELQINLQRVLSLEMVRRWRLC